MSNYNRIAWIDGLKGIASLMIFLHHFILAFIPALYYGTSVGYMLSNNEGVLADSPFLFFVGGHFLVNIFLLLSGLVLSLQVYRINSVKELITKMVSRYMRLAFPVFIISLLVYVLLRYGLFYNTQFAEITGSPWLSLYYKVPLSLKSVFETSFYSVWFIGNDDYSTAFWMLTHLFYGSILTYISIFSIRKINKQIQLFIILSLIIITGLYNSYLMNFTFGMLIAWMIIHQSKLIHQDKWRWLFIIAGCLLAGYPQGVIPTNYYRYLTPIYHYFKSNVMIHSLGSFFIVLGIFKLNVTFKFLNGFIAQYLGKLSYSIYLIHIPILFSITSILALTLHQYNFPYQFNILISLLISLILLIFLSEIFERFIIKPLNTVINSLIK